MCAYRTGPRIAADGLVLCLDAASTKSYPGAGTTWTSLVGSDTATLTANAAFSGVNAGVISFTGGGTRAVVGADPMFGFSTQPFTLETWIKPTLLNVDAAGYTFIDSRPAVNGAYPTLYIESAANANTLRYYVTGNRITGPTLVTGNWYHIVLARTGTVSSMYVNTQLAGTWATDSTAYLNTPPLLGTDAAGGATFVAAFRGQMALFRVYSGVGLTQDQVVGNFNAMRGRFGI